MAIEIKEDISAEEKKSILRNKKLIFIISWVIIVVLFLGTVIYYMFFLKPPEDLIKIFYEKGNHLTKEEISKIENLVNQIDKSEIKKFKTVY